MAMMMTIILYHLLDIEKKDDKNRFEGWENAFFFHLILWIDKFFRNIYVKKCVRLSIKHKRQFEKCLLKFEYLIDLLCIFYG